MPSPPSKLQQFLKRAPAGSGDFLSLGDYTHGNKLALLTRGGETLKSMWEAIDAARETIHLEMYIFASDSVGEEFARRLMKKARAGVRVRVIIDSLGSLNINPVFLTKMRNSGIQFLEYHPVAPWRARWAWGRRDHRKILVIDGQIGFTGGLNISNEYASLEMGGSDWHDTQVRVEGPAAYDLDRLFRATWFKETGRWFDSAGRPAFTPGVSMVAVAANQEFLHRYTIRSTYLKVLRAARKEVMIANAYFVPDRGIRRALGEAVKRGVSVKILVPARSDVASVWYAGRNRYESLLRKGIRLFEWLGPNLHAKTAVVDAAWCAVGSYNLDHRSLLHNLEVNLHILDEDFAGRMASQFNFDVAHSREITTETWRQRPKIDRVFERFFYGLRYFF